MMPPILTSAALASGSLLPISAANRSRCAAQPAVAAAAGKLEHAQLAVGLQDREKISARRDVAAYAPVLDPGYRAGLDGKGRHHVELDDEILGTGVAGHLARRRDHRPGARLVEFVRQDALGHGGPEGLGDGPAICLDIVWPLRRSCG